MVFFMFGNRGCSWLPGNRVLNTILGKAIVVQQAELDEAAENGLTREDIIQFLNTGDIDFGESIKAEYPKFYKITYEKDDKIHHGQFSIMDETFVSEFKYLRETEKVVEGFTPEGFGYIIKLPLDSSIVHVSKNLSQVKSNVSSSEFEEALQNNDTEKAASIVNDSIASENLAVQQNAARIGATTEEIQAALEKNGYIDFSKSHLKIPAKPEHYMVCTLENGKTIEFQAIWYKNKIEINKLYKTAND